MADNRATNCLFINNYAPYGGAMEGGSATNCTFENNHADYYGGAILGAYAENCTFDANHEIRVVQCMTTPLKTAYS